MRGPRRELTQADKDARRQAGRDKAAAAAARLEGELERLAGDDAAFAEYLRLSGRLYGYSFRNRILIMLQRPDTRMVAGFHRWRELGRPVVKGAKGIQILAPMTGKREDTLEDGSVETRVFTRGFRVAYVFAVEDTDGVRPALPDAIPCEDDGPAAGELERRLLSAAGVLGVPCSVVSRAELEHCGGSGSRGFYHVGTRSILVGSDAAAAMRAKTIAHELGHALEHRAGELKMSDRPAAELVAECVACAVMSHYGVDTTAYSAPYVAHYCKGDTKRLGRLLDRVQAVAGELIAAAEGCGPCRTCGWDGVADGGGCETCR